MEGPDLDRLQLPQMVTSSENDESMYTAFAVTVDLRAGTSTGMLMTLFSVTVTVTATSARASLGVLYSSQAQMMGQYYADDNMQAAA